MADDDDFGGSDFGGDAELELEPKSENVIPFPRMRPEPTIVEQWIRERDLANQKHSKAYRFRGPLEALDDLIRQRELPPAPMPWPELAKRCVLYPGQAMAISGPSGGGKTQFAIQIATWCAGKGVPVLWNPLELDEPELNLRIVANLSHKHTLHVRESWERDQLAHVLTAVSDRWRYVDRERDAASQVMAIRTAVQIAKRIYRRPPAVFIDYVGKLARGMKDPRLGLADAIEWLRALAVEEECYLFLLSQTSRGNNAVLTGKVELESAADAIGVSAETGELEHACAVNVALNVFKADDAESLGAHVLVSKARNTGREGRQGFSFHKAGGVWEELGHLPPTPGEVTAEVKKQKKKDQPAPDAKATREDLNWRRQAEAAAARRELVLEAIKRAGMFGIGERELRKLKGAGNPRRLKQTLEELSKGDLVSRSGRKWIAVPR